MNLVLQRGDVVLVPFPFTDLSGLSLRPAVVVSTGLIGEDVVLAGISSVLRGAAVASDFVVDSTTRNSGSPVFAFLPHFERTSSLRLSVRSLIAALAGLAHKSKVKWIRD